MVAIVAHGGMAEFVKCLSYRKLVSWTAGSIITSGPTIGNNLDLLMSIASAIENGTRNPV